MYLSSKPSRLTTTAKARLHHQTHKLDNIESRNKRSEESNQSGSSQGPPSPSEVIVFNNTSHTGPGRNIQTRSDPHVPNAEDIHRYMRETWERRMQEIKTQNLSVLWIEGDSKENNGTQSSALSSHPPPFSSATAASSGSSSLQNPAASANKGKTSPQHAHRK